TRKRPAATHRPNAITRPIAERSEIVGVTDATSVEATASAALSDELVSQTRGWQPSELPAAERGAKSCARSASNRRVRRCASAKERPCGATGNSKRFWTTGDSALATRCSDASSISTKGGGAGESGSTARTSCSQFAQSGL